MNKKDNSSSKKMSRRDFLKKSGRVAGGALLGSSMLSTGTNLFAGKEEKAVPTPEKTVVTEKLPVPLNQNKFGGIKLSYVQDSNWINTIEYVAPHIAKEGGVDVGNREMFKIGEGHAKIVPQLLAAKPRWDFMVYSPMYLGDFVNMGALEPLDDYFAQYEGTEEYWDQVMPAYKNFYNFWGDKTYGVMVDGDIHLLHYRPSYFNDKDMKTKFERRFKMELVPPVTWDDYLKVAQFLTEETPDGIYGSQMVVNPPAFAWGFFFDLAVANGAKYFDENMNPLIASPEAEEALEMWKEVIRWSPPGGESMGIDETIKTWQNGSTLMALWWIDLSEFTAQQVPEMGDDQAATLVPGWRKGGKVVHRSLLLYDRICSIPSKIPQERKEAAFYFIYRLSHHDYSVHYVADEYSGSDPYMKIHYETPEEYIKPNPLRGTSELWPTNAGIFKSIDTAKNHLEAGLANVKVGYPQFNWTGAVEYAEALGRNVAKAVTRELTSRQALESTAEEWESIVQKYGYDSQKEQYAVFVDTAKKMGYW
jgi:multiple sugar transport system substrate-binding protein